MLVDSKTCVKALLDGGANPTIENEAGHRAVEYAKEGEIKEMLIKHAIRYDEIVKEKVCTETIFLYTNVAYVKLYNNQIICILYIKKNFLLRKRRNVVDFHWNNV